jgi:hypothetical protein
LIVAHPVQSVREAVRHPAVSLENLRHQKRS